MSGCVATGIVYQRDGNIWSMATDGSNQKLLTPNGEFPQWRPGIEPKGKDAIAFVQRQMPGPKYLLFTMDEKGGNLGQIASDVGPNFCWSPDGKWIAYEKFHQNNWEIFKIELSTRKEFNLTNNGAEDRGPNWSPKENKIAFESKRREGDWDIWVMDANGTNQKNVTASGLGNGADLVAVWSPNGKFIAFLGEHPSVVNFGLSPRICLADMAQGTIKPLSQQGITHLSGPVWNPQEAVFFMGDGSSPYGSRALYKQPLTSPKAEVVTEAPITDIQGRFAVDAVFVYYARMDYQALPAPWSGPPWGTLNIHRIRWLGGTNDTKLGEGYNPSYPYLPSP
jgi:Tol biopolymer transport system component